MHVDNDEKGLQVHKILPSSGHCHFPRLQQEKLQKTILQIFNCGTFSIYI